MVFLKPSQIIKNFDLEHGMIVADFGCGSGHYSVEAAKIVGKSGKVYAIDVQKEMLEAVKSRSEAEGLDNLEIIRADLELSEGSHLASGIADAVIMSNILFQSEDKNAIAEEAFRILKVGGKIAVIEWDKRAGKIGPSPELRVSAEDARKIFEKAGFNSEGEFEASESHYGIIFRKHV